MTDKQPIFNLDAEEKTLSDSFDRGEWRREADVKKELAKSRTAATNSLRKDSRINIGLSSISCEKT